MIKNNLTVSCNKDIRTCGLAAAAVKHLSQDARLRAELEMVSSAKIKSLNQKFRGTDKITDVLSFPSLQNIKGVRLLKNDYPLDTDPATGEIFLGSIALCESVAKKQAKKYGHSYERELYYLITHGLLHLFGFDHEGEADKKEMRALEEKILAEAIN